MLEELLYETDGAALEVDETSENTVSLRRLYQDNVSVANANTLRVALDAERRHWSMLLTQDMRPAERIAETALFLADEESANAMLELDDTDKSATAAVAGRAEPAVAGTVATGIVPAVGTAEDTTVEPFLVMEPPIAPGAAVPHAVPFADAADWGEEETMRQRVDGGVPARGSRNGKLFMQLRSIIQGFLALHQPSIQIGTDLTQTISILGCTGHCIHTPATTPSTPPEKRRYQFQDQDFMRAGIRLTRDRMSKQMQNLMAKLRSMWITSQNLDDFTVHVHAFMARQTFVPMEARTVINWFTKLCVQQYLQRYIAARYPENELAKDARNVRSVQGAQGVQGTRSVQGMQGPPVHAKESSGRVLARARGYRALGEIPAPLDGKDLDAWTYWLRQKQGRMVHVFLKQWVLLGPVIFWHYPIYFGTGGRQADPKLYIKDPMTMEKLQRFIGTLRDNPGKSLIAAHDGDTALDTIMDGTETYRGRQVRDHLNRIGIKQRRAHVLDERAQRMVSYADVKRFEEFVQQKLEFGPGGDDVIWMDETSLSLTPARMWAWGLAKSPTVTTQAKNIAGGEYNMMLSIGIIQGQPFIHYLVYKPQREGVVLDSVLNGVPVAVLHGKRAKVRGTYGSILNYLFGIWGDTQRTMHSIGPWDRKGHRSPESLCDLVKRMRGNAQTPLYFLWDNFSGHFAQMIRGDVARTAQIKTLNPAFWTVPAMFASKGVTNVQMMFLPRYMPQFSPCERVFSHLKTYVANHSSYKNNTISETTLFANVHKYLEHLTPNSMVNLVTACHYRTTFQSAPPHVHAKTLSAEDVTTLCNQLDMDTVPPPRVHGQVVCYSKDTGLISRYLPPGSDRWHVLSQLSTLFDKQVGAIVNTFQQPPAVKSSEYFAVYSGYGGDAYLKAKATDIRALETAIAELQMFVTAAFDEPMAKHILPQYTWLIITLLSSSDQWTLHPYVMQNAGEYMLWQHMQQPHYFAVLHCGKQTDALKVNLLIGRTKPQRTALDFSALKPDCMAFYATSPDSTFAKMPPRTRGPTYRSAPVVTAPVVTPRLKKATGVQRSMREFIRIQKPMDR